MKALKIRQDECALDFLSLGALVHRLDPGVIPFRKARTAEIHVSGGEYNVAAGLSDCFGLKTGIASAMVKYGIGELVKLCCGEIASAVKSVCCLNDSTTCTAAVGSTYATPADPKHTDGGLSIANADTVASTTTNTTDDTIEVDHVFTASATRNVSGVIICNDDDDVNVMECCFNAVLPMESSDTLTYEGKIIFDQA